VKILSEVLRKQKNEKMEITEIQIIPIRPNDGLLGFASFVIDDWLYLGSIGIYTRLGGGYRLTYPTKNSYNIVYPINKSTAEKIENAVINKFEEVTKYNDRYSQVSST
jgi:DNA-binding cell septation regulator SpoVG